MCDRIKKKGFIMPNGKSFKIKTKHPDLSLRVTKGHFSTNHSHTNYYIDVTMQKSRLSEASAVAKELVSYYNSNTIVDTILCLDGTEVIGTCLAEELTNGSFANLNSHQTIYVVKPEYTAGSHMMFRDNIVPMIEGKNVLILAASVTTGYTAQSAVEAVTYYDGYIAGICAIFSTADTCAGYSVNAIFNPNKDLEDYESYASHDCPLCKAGKKIHALINSYGYSKL